MNRSQLVEAVAAQTGLSDQAANSAITATLETITGAVSGGDTVTLPGFGTFERRSRAARSGRNPQTGEPMEIPAGLFPAFKAGQAFRRQVSGN